MSKLNFDIMSRDQLARFIVAHRDTADGIEARRVYIRRMEEKAKSRGIEFHRPEAQAKSIDPNSDL